MIEFVSGYCPVLKHEYSIEVNYSQATQNKYIKSGAVCEYNADATHAECPMRKECPLYSSLPQEKFYPSL